MQVIHDQVAEGEDEITTTQFVADNLMNAILGEKISDFQNLRRPDGLLFSALVLSYLGRPGSHVFNRNHPNVWQ